MTTGVATVASARTTVVIGGILAVIGLTAGCGSTSGHHPVSAVPPSRLLLRSRQVVDATSEVHFALSSTGATGKGIELTGGSGDLLRPDDLTGSFTVTDAGLDVSVGVVEVGGRFYAQPPFASHYTVTDPATYGLGDPAALLAPRTGVSSLLTSMSDVRSQGEHRISGELVQVVSGSIPGRAVPVLPDADRSAPVTLTASIDPGSYQLRQVVLAGPFTSAGATTTYTVTLTRYGEVVHIVAPPT